MPQISKISRFVAHNHRIHISYIRIKLRVQVKGIMPLEGGIVLFILPYFQTNFYRFYFCGTVVSERRAIQ